MVNLKKAVTGRVLREIRQLADKDAHEYATFWTHFGPFIKHGVVTDFENKDRLVELLRFHSTHSEDTLMSLQDYVERMKDVEGQEAIYYVIADNVATASRSPHLEPFRERGIEVLYFTDTVDSFLINSLLEYEEHPLQNVDDEDLDLSSVGTVPEDTEQPEDMPDADQLETVTNRFKNVLGERVASVRVSKVLTGKSPARLVSPEGTLDRHTQRVYKMLNQEYEVPQKILEINPHHTLTHNLLSLMQAGRDEALIDLAIEQIYENALLLDGLHPNPADMVDRIQTLLETATER
jgi:molecular chaperone HtpG